MDILNRIAQLRDKRGWSNTMLSDESDISLSTIQSWFSKRYIPSFDALKSICKAFGITMSQFFFDGEERVSLSDIQYALLDEWDLFTDKEKRDFLRLLKTFNEAKKK